MGDGRRALFLDRDGVINEDCGFIHRPEDFRFLPGVLDGCRLAREAGYLLVVVTNQSGIGRGLYTEADFHRLTRWMCDAFNGAGAALTDVYFAPTHPTLGIGAYRRDSDDRKPGAGMLYRARAEHGIDLGVSALIGDRETDIAAATAAGLAQKILVAEDRPGGTGADVVVGSLLDGVGWLLTTRDGGVGR